MTSSPLLNDLGVILLAGFICGVFDITCTLILSRLNGVNPKRVLQTIASGALGSRAFTDSGSTAVLGLGLHFLIAIVSAAAYFAASRKLSILIEHAVLCGLLYGIAVHLFMTFIVLPMSSIRRPFSVKFLAIQLVIHMFFVGLPIALIVRHFS
jgi:uncharacterized membrane protein YagU involved in acid resistance